MTITTGPIAGLLSRAIVIIGTDGAVKSCSVIASSGHSRLDAKSCQVAERRWLAEGQPIGVTLSVGVACAHNARVAPAAP